MLQPLREFGRGLCVRSPGLFVGALLVVLQLLRGRTPSAWRCPRRSQCQHHHAYQQAERDETRDGDLPALARLLLSELHGVRVQLPSGG